MTAKKLIPHTLPLTSEYLKYHKRLLERACTLGFDIESGRRISTLQLLAKLRHFGAATGLLDFTWNPLVALWVASEDYNCNGRMFIVNTDDTVNTEWVSDDDNNYDLKTIFSRTDSSVPRLLLWEPSLAGDAMLRILRQRSVFIIGRPLIPYEQMISDGQMKTIDLSKEEKKLIREHLRTLDITQITLFQDVYGFCETESVTSPLVRIMGPEDYLLQANEHYRRREYEKAIDAYSKCIELEPKVCETYFLRGNAKSELGMYKESIEDYDLAISNKNRPTLGFGPSNIVLESNSLLSMVYYNRGNAKACERDYEGALKNYTEAIRLVSVFPAVFFNRGNVNAETCEFLAAVKDYDDAVKLGYPKAMFNKGNVLVIMGRFQDAFDCYKELHDLQIKEKGIADEYVVRNFKELERLIEIAGNQFAGINSETEFKQTRVRTMSINNYKGDTKNFVFQGNVGNTGNMGGNKQHGGEGFSGGEGFGIQIAGVYSG